MTTRILLSKKEAGRIKSGLEPDYEHYSDSGCLSCGYITKQLTIFKRKSDGLLFAIKTEYDERDVRTEYGCELIQVESKIVQTPILVWHEVGKEPISGSHYGDAEVLIDSLEDLFP